MIKVAQILKEHGHRFKQIYGQYYDGDGKTSVGRCAVGVIASVALADGASGVDARRPAVKAALPCLYRPAPLCPVDNCASGAHLHAASLPMNGMVDLSGCDHPWRLKLANLITHLNDDHRWTFDQIASFLETLPDEPATCGGPMEGYVLEVM